ncbi:MAG: hypothetical protein ACKO3P_00180, partial [Planctomycetaceae bacterium]
LRKLLSLGGETVSILLERRATLESVRACRAVDRRLSAFFAPSLSRRERDTGLAAVWDDPDLVQPGGGPVMGDWATSQTRRTLVREARRRGVADRGPFTRVWRFAQRWIPRGLLLTSLLWGLVTAWLLWSQPAGLPGQLAVLRRQLAQVAPADRAWPLVRDWAVGMQGFKRFVQDPQTILVMGAVPLPASGGPADPTDEIRQQPGPVELLVQASQQPQLGFDPDVEDPGLPLPPDGLLQMFSRGTRTPPPLLRLILAQALLTTARHELLGHGLVANEAHDLRRTGELLAARIRLWALEFEQSSPVLWQTSVLPDSQLFGELILFLHAIEDDETLVEDRLLQELHAALQQLERPLAERLQPGSDLWRQDRALALDELYSQGAVGLITEEGLRTLMLWGNLLYPALDSLPTWEISDPAAALHWARQRVLAPPVTLWVATRAQVEAEDERLEREAEALVQRQGLLRTTARQQLEDQLLSSRWQRVRWAPLAFVRLRSETGKRSTWLPWLTAVRQLRIQLAALRHRRRTGAWPQQISELVPAELEAIPQIPAAELPADLDWANSLRQPMPMPMPVPNPRPEDPGVELPIPTSP